MRATLEHLDKFREPHPVNGHKGGPNFGFFKIPHPVPSIIGKGHHFIAMAVAGRIEEGVPWDHVSVHGRFYTADGLPCYFTPTWGDMCWIKSQFFEPGECAMQLHVPESEHVNTHHYTLHLWRPLYVAIPQPPQICV